MQRTTIYFLVIVHLVKHIARSHLRMAQRQDSIELFPVRIKVDSLPLQSSWCVHENICVDNCLLWYPYTSQKNISPKIICQKNISLNFLFPELTFVRNHTCQNEHLPEITSARMNICLKLHLPE